MTQLELLQDMRDAISFNDEVLFDCVLLLIKDINALLPDLLYSPLEYAVHCNKISFVQKLLAVGANTDRNDTSMGVVADKCESPLLIAVSQNYTKIAHLLLDSGAKPDILWYSLYYLHTDTINNKFFEDISLKMIKLGGRIGGKNTMDYGLYKAIISDNVPILDALLVKDYIPSLCNNVFPIIRENSGNASLEKHRLPCGIINSQIDNYKVRDGVGLEDYEKYIWMNGSADLEERYTIPHFKGNTYQGASLVHQAVLHNAKKILTYLLKRGVPFDLLDSGEHTPYDYAVFRKDEGMKAYIKSVIEKQLLEKDGIDGKVVKGKGIKSKL